jgi:putative hemolysin
MLDLRKGRYVARLAESEADLGRALALRARMFRAGADDGDDLDAACRHVLVSEQSSGRAVCTFRLMLFETGAHIPRSYSARYYELAALARVERPMAELGRFCIAPDRAGDPDLLRVAWGAIAAHVEAADVHMLFGCSSFCGTDVGRYLDAFALLRDRYLAPALWLPRAKAPDVFRFTAGHGVPQRPDERRGLTAMPPLLRSYLAMGGRVSDHAVIDRDLGTLHVFTGLEIAAIPASRARLLRAMAAA